MPHFMVDRRPSGVYSCYGGIGEGRDEFGRDLKWVNNPAERMAYAAEYFKEANIDECWLHMPHGAAPSPSWYCCTVDSNLPAAAKDYFEFEFMPEFGQEWGIYLGMAMPIPTEPDSLVTAPDQRLASSHSDARTIASELEIFGDAGFTMAAFDMAGHKERLRWLLGPMRNRLPWADVIAAEPMPTIVTDEKHTPDHELLKRCPFVILDGYLQTLDPMGEFWIDPHESEVHVWMDTVANADRAADLHRRGFLPGPFLGVTPQDAIDWIANAPNNR